MKLVIDLDIDILKNKLKDRVPEPMDIEGKYSVLIPLIENKGQWEIIYEVRSMKLRSQPGEISFPGGKVEDGESFKDAAIRETMEELNLSPENIEIMGELDYLVSYSNFRIHCFLGRLKGIALDDIVANNDEVDHIFTVPLEYFLNNKPERYALDLQTVDNDEFPYSLVPNGKDYKWRIGKHSVLFYKYGKYIIWGFTAKMTSHLIDIMKDL